MTEVRETARSGWFSDFSSASSTAIVTPSIRGVNVMRPFLFGSLIGYHIVRIEHYTTPSGVTVFRSWMAQLRDSRGKAAIARRLDAVEAHDHLGDCRRIWHGLGELRIDTGPGYRVYFGHVGKKAIVLLIGGDKSTQRRDIRQALRYWRDWQAQMTMQDSP